MASPGVQQDIFDHFISLTFGSLEQDKHKLREFELNYVPFFPRERTARLLDIGVGRGEMLQLWKELGYQSIIGIDVGREPVEFCRSNVTPNVELVESSCAWLRQHPDEFRVITAIDVLDHMAKRELNDTLSAIRYALAKDGVLIARVTNLASPSGAFLLRQDITHETGLTPDSFSQLLRLASFRQWYCLPHRDVVDSPKGRCRIVLRNIYYLLVRLARRLEHAHNPRILTPTFVVVASKSEDKRIELPTRIGDYSYHRFEQ